MSVAIVSGSAGLVGSEAARHFASRGLHVVGVDNDMRATFFGEGASTSWNARRLLTELGESYEHFDIDIRDRAAINDLFSRYGKSVVLVVHAAAQPSHDWAAREPQIDFDINAVGTLNMLEGARNHSPGAVFIFCSTNKVYGDAPNRLPLMELETRFDIDPAHTYADGIKEDMPIDQSLHSVFGASKLAADVMVQEYGRYFSMPTASFRGGTLTGPHHSAAELHGFLAYVMRCAMTRTRYKVFGYKGKQVRDAIHCADLISAFDQFSRNPRVGEVYNIGGSRFSNCSVLEAIGLCQEITGNQMDWSYEETNRIGDHIWWIGSNEKFQAHYPSWSLNYDHELILKEIYEVNAERWGQ